MMVPKIFGKGEEGIVEKLFGREQMTACFARYEETAELFQREARLLGSADSARELEQLRLRLRQGPVRLLVIGMSCSGKSTLVNTLAEDFVAPEGATATSCIPLWVSGKPAETADGETEFYMLFQKDGSLAEKPCNMVVALNQLCHAPGEGTEAPEGLAAVTVRTGRQFLRESGLTLIDTPGIGQQKMDDEWTERSASLGAEMLLIAHGSSKKILEKEIQTLFPAGERDLGLDMQRDLFLLGNDIFSTKQGVCLTLKELVAKWNSKGEKRFYWMNILEQRRRMGHYRYSKWYPVGANDKAVNKKKEREDFERHQMFQEAMEAAESSGGGIRRGIELYEEMKAEQNLKAAPGEAERENILQALPNRKKKALADWNNLEKLRGDLKKRAGEIYSDPGRICTPIEETLGRIGKTLLERCQKEITEEEEKIRKEAAELKNEYFISNDEAYGRDWKHFEAFVHLKVEIDEKTEEAALMRNSLENEMKRAGKKCERLLKKNAVICGTQAIAGRLEEALYFPRDGEKKLREDWREQLVKLAPGFYREYRNKARGMLLDRTLFSPMEEAAGAVLEGKRQREVLEAMRAVTAAACAALEEMGETALSREISGFSFELPDLAPPSDPTVFDTADDASDVEGCAGALAEELTAVLKQWQEEQKAKEEAENKADTWLKKRAFKVANTLRDLLTLDLRTRILTSIGRTERDIAQDIAGYLRGVVEPQLAAELEFIKKAEEELKKTEDRIDKRQEEILRNLQTELVSARERNLREQLQKQEPKKRRMERIRQALETLRNDSPLEKVEEEQMTERTGNLS